MSLLNKFLQFVEDEKLFSPNEPILLAVSGGIDSTCMCELFHQAGFRFSIAHCNFKLREKDSEDDFLFVQELAKKYNVPFFSITFSTKEYAEQNKLSIQMAARTLRYNWFEQIREENNFPYISVGHHFDDSIETFFINMLRGTGIKGLRGILPKNGNIIRPLLFCTRQEIEEFGNENQIAFRQDLSNYDTKYKRNKIRKDIIPIFKKMNPSFEEVFRKEMSYLKDTEYFVNHSIDKIKLALLKTHDQHIAISFKDLKNYKPEQFVLYQILSEYGFSETTVENILQKRTTFSGKEFFSATHRIVLNRGEILISPKTELENETSLIFERDKTIKKPVKLKFSVVEKTEAFEMKPSKDIAYFDYDKIQFPAQIRNWNQGDSFYPFGMRGKKLLSNFFRDQKLSLLEKENTYVLCSGNGNILWIIGHRTDNRFRITDKTKKVWVVELA